MDNNTKWQMYLQPNGTLKNLLGITDANELQEIEYLLTINHRINFCVPSCVPSFVPPLFTVVAILSQLPNHEKTYLSISKIPG